MRATHEVFNQVPPLIGINRYLTDPALRAAVARHGAGWAEAALDAQGARVGSAEAEALAEDANRNPPSLHSHDRHGRRIDRVAFHPAWSQLLAMLHGDGVHSDAWLHPRTGAHVARAAAFYLHGQLEAGSLCPVTMSFAALPLLQREPALWAGLDERFRSRDYDARDLPLAAKHSVTVGMGMTEKQGGSDLRANTTRARPLEAPGRGGDYLLSGHKWFFSVPNADAHLVLAQTDDGPSCFFVPRWRGDGSRNPVRIQRLKDKLGNRSNASAEVEFDDAHGILVGEPGRGIPALIEVAAQTRLDCVLGSAALMRRALVEAIHHARHRSAFGHPLIDHALMRNLLADLALESEAALVLAMRLAAATDAEHGTPGSSDASLGRAWRRLLTPAAKFWICKRAIAFTAECLEVWGGNGYVEDGPMARLFREAPVNSIWEGSANLMCLDVLRAITREPDAAAQLLADLSTACAGDADLRGACERLAAQLPRPLEAEWAARDFCTQLVLLAQATLLRHHLPAAIADAFIVSRLRQRRGQVAGQLPDPGVATLILERALPP